MLISLWWAIISNFIKINVALSVFTGPQVELPFSMMNDIITPHASCMSVETYSSYMSVKYSLISEGKSAAARYSKKNVMRDPINKIIAYYLRTARSQYVKQLKTQRDKKEKISSLYIATGKRMQLKGQHKKENEHEKVKYSFKT